VTSLRQFLIGLCVGLALSSLLIASAPSAAANEMPNEPTLVEQCPEDALGTPGACYTTVDREAAFCAVGSDLVNGLCEFRIVYVPLGQASNGTCPTFAPATAQVIGLECVTITTSEPIALCPTLSVDVLGECRIPVDTEEVLEELPRSPYPGPFEAVPSGTQASLLAAPAITVQSSVPLTAQNPAPRSTELAYTGLNTTTLIVALSMISAGSGSLAISRRGRDT